MHSQSPTDPVDLQSMFSARARAQSSTDKGSSQAEAVPERGEVPLAPPSDPSLRQLFEKRYSPVTTAGATDQGSRNDKLSRLVTEAKREVSKESGDARGAKTNLTENQIRRALDRAIGQLDENISDVERAESILLMKQELSTWGILEPLINNPDVTDIHAYDFQTVVVQRGKQTELTHYRWQSHQAYVSFIDRLLLSLDRSLSTQQHTVDVAFPSGIRICCVHESICGQRGPFLTIRVPRVSNVSIPSLIEYKLAPAQIFAYLAALVASQQATIIIAGETGKGKTTLLRALASQFGPKESTIAVEDTPEVNSDHPFFRSLVSRPPNIEGMGEVTLQEQIKTTLRMTPSRVILGEMRTPPAAEAFLESAQTGHTGLSTIHARNARETLIRLENLLGRAQKSVSPDILRQQIALAVDVVVWIFRERETGIPRIGEVIEVCNYSEGSIQVRPIFTFDNESKEPRWILESWSSTFDKVLQAHGCMLNRLPKQIYLQTGNETK